MGLFKKLNWGTDRVEHVARHNIDPEEVEEAVFFDSDRRLRRGPRSEKDRGHFVYYLYGCTEAGRYLFVVLLDLNQGDALMVTARDMTKSERQYYEGR